MYESLPKLDRAKLRQRLQAEFDRALDEVADAVDRAPAGRVIRESEEPARNALDRFRQVIYQEVVQAKVDAAEAAFPPSAQRGDRQTSTTSGPPAVQPADDQRPFAVVARSFALPVCLWLARPDVREFRQNRSTVPAPVKKLSAASFSPTPARISS